ncbi:MAG: hypothetical protein AAFQ89_11610 [Cyanobacteria bacterium J06626_18]
MVYSAFTLSKVKDDFNLATDTTHDLFAKTPASEPSELLATLLKRDLPLANAINTEKAKSELV